MAGADAASLDDVDAVNRRVDDLERRFAEAFPGGDHVGHCRYHQLMIEDIADRRALIKAVKEKTVAGLVWGAIVGIVAACWHYLVTYVRGGS